MYNLSMNLPFNILKRRCAINHYCSRAAILLGCVVLVVILLLPLNTFALIGLNEGDAPIDIVLEDINGKGVNVTAFFGKHPVIIVFWELSIDKSFINYSLDELIFLNERYDEYKAKYGLEIFGIYTPEEQQDVSEEEISKVRDLIKMNKIKFPVLIDRGFRKVKAKDYKPRLLHVAGYKKHVQVYQVGLDASNLNNSDSFVLDCGLTIFQFNGSKSSAWEKRKANAIVDELQASRHGKVKTTLIVDGLEDSGNPLINDFWAYFGGKPQDILDHEEEKKVPDYTLSLHHISDASGVMEINEVCSGKLDKDKLDGNDAFLLDAGGSVFVWVGRGANKAEKREVSLHGFYSLFTQIRISRE